MGERLRTSNGLQMTSRKWLFKTPYKLRGNKKFVGEGLERSFPQKQVRGDRRKCRNRCKNFVTKRGKTSFPMKKQTFFLLGVLPNVP